MHDLKPILTSHVNKRKDVFKSQVCDFLMFWFSYQCLIHIYIKKDNKKKSKIM